MEPISWSKKMQGFMIRPKDKLPLDWGPTNNHNALLLFKTSEHASAYLALHAYEEIFEVVEVECNERSA